MPTVYLIAQPTIPRGPGKKPFDVTPLYEHGEVVVLVRAGEYPTFNPGDCLELIEKRLAKYDPQQDCVAWAGGDTLSAILAGVVLADLGHETMTYLRHERGRDANGKRTDEGGRYTRITVPLWTKRAKQHVQHDPRQQDLFTTHEGAHAHGS